MSNPKIQHFAPHEFLCNCGECDLTYDDMDADFLRTLEQARIKAGVLALMKRLYETTVEANA